MTSRYVEVDRSAFISALEEKGFTRDSLAKGEVVYTRQHHADPTMQVKIFTSLPNRSGDARACGQDAIRVLLIFTNPKSGKSGCLFKAARVYRTGTQEKVIERTIERAREAYAEATRRFKLFRAA